MAEIMLVYGQVEDPTGYKAKVDDALYPWILRFSPKWFVSSAKNPRDTPRMVLYGQGGYQATVQLNRLVWILAQADTEKLEFLCGTKEGKETVWKDMEHIGRVRALNGNKLDCRFENLSVKMSEFSLQKRRGKLGYEESLSGQVVEDITDEEEQNELDRIAFEEREKQREKLLNRPTTQDILKKMKDQYNKPEEQTNES